VYGAEEVKHRPSQFWKEPSYASGSSFQRVPPISLACVTRAGGGEILPLPFLPYRRVKIQGRGRVRIQVHV
jgi:hypothetical protein